MQSTRNYYFQNEAVKNGRILWNVNVDSTVKIVNDCEILDTIPLLDLMEYNRNIYFDLKDKITSEDKAFLKWCPALKDGITDLVKRREEYAIYLNIMSITESELYFGLALTSFSKNWCIHSSTLSFLSPLPLIVRKSTSSVNSSQI